MKQNHENKKKLLRKIGLILIIIGGLLTIIGLISFFSSFNGGGFPTLFPLAMGGIPCLGIGLMLLLIGYNREISTYFKDEGIPVIKEGYQDLRPEVEDVVSIIKGEQNEKVCSYCNTKNNYNSSYCKNCGKPIGSIVCPKCGKKIDIDSRFCSHCGHEIK